MGEEEEGRCFLTPYRTSLRVLRAVLTCNRQIDRWIDR